MRSGAELYAWLASLPASERDAAVETMLGLPPTSSESPGPHLVGHHLTSVSAIVRLIHEVPIGAEDVVLDLGAGVGKLLALIHLFSGARVRGVEIQRDLVDVSIAIANVEHGDARSSSLAGSADAGPTVIVLYCPFEGPVLDEVSRRLDALDDVIVCALGTDLRCTRLRPRPSADFWMTVWDPPGSPSGRRQAIPLGPLAQVLAHDRDDH